MEAQASISIAHNDLTSWILTQTIPKNCSKYLVVIKVHLWEDNVIPFGFLFLSRPIFANIANSFRVEI